MDIAENQTATLEQFGLVSIERRTLMNDAAMEKTKWCSTTMVKTTFCLLVFMLAAISCQKQCPGIHRAYKARCVNFDTTYTFSLGELTDFDWDVIYIVDGPKVDSEAGELIGLTSYKGVIQDGATSTFFILDSTIVMEYDSECLRLPASGRRFGLSTKYVPESKLRVRKELVDGRVKYHVEIENED